MAGRDQIRISTTSCTCNAKNDIDHPTGLLSQIANGKINIFSDNKDSVSASSNIMN